MAGILFALLLHLTIAAIELPPLWGQKEQGGERWAVIGLLLISLGACLMVASDTYPPSLWELIDAIFRPVGTPLFQPQRG